MSNIFLLVFSFIALMLILVFARIAFTFIFDVVAHGILPFAIVRFLTWTMEHWMGSTIAWTLSIIAGIVWGVYPRLKQLFTDPHNTIQDIREREASVDRKRDELNRKYSHHSSNSDADYVKSEVERCDTDKYN